MTDIPIDAFLSGPRNQEHEALLRLMGTSVPIHGTDTAVEPQVESTKREWSDAELSEMEDLLMREISIREIARFLQRDPMPLGVAILAVQRLRVSQQLPSSPSLRSQPPAPREAGSDFSRRSRQLPQ